MPTGTMEPMREVPKQFEDDVTPRPSTKTYAPLVNDVTNQPRSLTRDCCADLPVRHDKHLVHCSRRSRRS